MPTVHVFISTGRILSLEELCGFIVPTYTEEGDEVPSPFMREVGLDGYEPGCVEVFYWGQPISLTDLLDAASYSGQWLPWLDGTKQAEAAVCVFAPSVVRRPHHCSLEYC